MPVGTCPLRRTVLHTFRLILRIVYEPTPVASEHKRKKSRKKFPHISNFFRLLFRAGAPERISPCLSISTV